MVFIQSKKIFEKEWIGANFKEDWVNELYDSSNTAFFI